MADAPHHVRLLPSAQRDLDALDPPLFRRLADAGRALGVSPRAHGSQKLTGDEGYRVRVGDYRILYRVDDPTRTVFIYRVKHRREAYRER